MIVEIGNVKKVKTSEVITGTLGIKAYDEVYCLYIMWATVGGLYKIMVASFVEINVYYYYTSQKVNGGFS